MPYFLAIDLHPTHTTVAVQWEGQPPSLLPLDGTRPTIPTTVGIAANDEALIGFRAEALRSVDSSRVVDDFVLRLGDPRPVMIAGRQYSVPDLTGLFLQRVYGAATQLLRRAPDRLAITYPAALDGYRLQLLRDAVTKAGLPKAQLFTDIAARNAFTSTYGPSSAPTATAFGALQLLVLNASGAVFGPPTVWTAQPPPTTPALPRRQRRRLAAVIGASLVIAALLVAVVRSNSGDEPLSSPATTTTAAGRATSPSDTTSGTRTPGSTGGTSSTDTSTAPRIPAGSAATNSSTSPPPTAMTETIELDPRAVWQDGTPIGAADFDCTWRANLNTPGSIAPFGYDKITAVEQGANAHEVVISYAERFAAYKTLFGALIEKRAVSNCDDISGDFQTVLAMSGREWKLDSWDQAQEVLVPNTKYWGTKPTVTSLVIKAELDDASAAVTSGDVDYAYQLFSAGAVFEPAAGNVAVTVGSSSQFEALYFNQKAGRPFSDPAVRRAVYESIDLDAFFAQIYAPIAPGGSLLTCGPVARGPYCPSGLFGNRFDLAKAAATMTGAGYAKDADGFWARDGNVVDIKWMINNDNIRRRSAQAVLIPLLATAGFKVTADNCDSSCVFQDRLPSLDYDLAMYINTGSQDPSYLVPNFTGDNIPIDANSGLGLNDQAWDNATATAALHASETELDPSKRVADIQAAIVEMDRDTVLIPLYQFPALATYRTDRVDRVDGNLANTARAFGDVASWKDVDGDGKIVIGLADWPPCINPVTGCAGSFTYQWSVANLILPGVFNPTTEGGFTITDLVTAEPNITTP